MTNTLPTTLTHLGTMPVAEFIRDYWQQKPLLIRQAFPDFQTPISAEEIAGLALEEEVESRLVVEEPDPNNPMASAWRMEHGPLDDNVFDGLPASHWTLLIQAVDQIFPTVHKLLNRFRFIPNWRLDDVMVSYAAAGGGVGPHFDYYDVFLLQAEGRRHWRLGQMANATSPLRDDTDMKILTEFETSADWVLEPGDMLYIPPNLAHWGVALDNCMTFSIGFRAPSHSDLLLEFSQAISEDLAADARFTDPGFPPQDNPGLIHASAIDQAAEILRSLLDDKAKLAEWFGRYMTEPKRLAPTADEPSDGLRLAAYSRAAYIPTDQGAQLFINGESAECSLALAQAICSYGALEPSDYSPDDQALLEEAIAEGWLTDERG